jgi:hypothetical protein
MAKNKDFISFEDETPAPKKEIQYGVWTTQGYLGGVENMRVMSGVSISVAPRGGNDYEVNIVGTKSQIIAANIDEAKNTAKNMLRDRLNAALELTK